MLKFGMVAPDVRIGRGSLYEMLADRAVVLFFFPRAFTPG
jgi:peroxiredoxin